MIMNNYDNYEIGKSAANANWICGIFRALKVPIVAKKGFFAFLA